MTRSEFERLYDDYVRLVRSIVYRVCPRANLDDMTQEVFLRAWRGREQFRGQASPKTWLARIAGNVAIDTGRGVTRSDARFRIDEEPALASAPTTAAGGEGALAERDAVGRVLARLEPEERLLLVLACVEELSVDEMAEVFDIPAGTVKSRAFAARARFRELYQTLTVEPEVAHG